MSLLVLKMMEAELNEQQDADEDHETDNEIEEDKSGDDNTGPSGPAEIDLNEVTLGRWVKITYDDEWFLGLVIAKKLCPKSNLINVKIRCFETPIAQMKQAMELETEGRSIWYEKIYATDIVPNLVIIKFKHLYTI